MARLSLSHLARSRAMVSASKRTDLMTSWATLLDELLVFGAVELSEGRGAAFLDIAELIEGVVTEDAYCGGQGRQCGHDLVCLIWVNGSGGIGDEDEADGVCAGGGGGESGIDILDAADLDTSADGRSVGKCRWPRGIRQGGRDLLGRRRGVDGPLDTRVG